MLWLDLSQWHAAGSLGFERESVHAGKITTSGVVLISVHMRYGARHSCQLFQRSIDTHISPCQIGNVRRQQHMASGSAPSVQQQVVLRSCAWLHAQLQLEYTCVTVHGTGTWYVVLTRVQYAVALDARTVQHYERLGQEVPPRHRDTPRPSRFSPLPRAPRVCGLVFGLWVHGGRGLSGGGDAH